MKSILKFTSLLLASAVMFISCDKTGDDTSLDSKFKISSDKNVIQSNGLDVATFTAILEGADVTAETVFYLKETMTPLEGNKFTADKAGVYNVIGMYGTFFTEPYSVTAIDMPIPAPAEDSTPSNTSFVHRAFLNQYTGTECGYCPIMVYILRDVFADESVKDKAVLAAVHSYQAGDPAYISNPKVQGYPYLQIDMKYGFTHDLPSSTLKNQINETTAAPAKVGISANPTLKDDMLVVTVEVKAAEEAEYNVGVWLMQDNVYGIQADYSGFNDKTLDNHNNCVRVADSKYMSRYAGHPLGKINAGQTAQRTFLFNIDKKAWKLTDINDLHFAAFVTSDFKVVNVVDCKISEPTPYEYK